MGLAEEWEKDECVRHLLRQQGALIQWRKPECVGVVSLQTLGVNHKVLGIVVDWHCPNAPKMKPPPVGLIRKEAPVFFTMT